MLGSKTLESTRSTAKLCYSCARPASLHSQCISYAQRLVARPVECSRCEPIPGFFRGLSPALVGICPAIWSHGLTYFVLKQIVSRGAWYGERHGDLTELLCGSAAILSQNVVTNPIGVVQTRMQVHIAVLTVLNSVRCRCALRKYCTFLTLPSSMLPALLIGQQHRHANKRNAYEKEHGLKPQSDKEPCATVRMVYHIPGSM